MTQAGQLLEEGRRFKAALLIVVAALAVFFAFQGSSARAEIEPEVNPLTGCISERICTWTGTSFGGEEKNWGCGGFLDSTGVEWKSAKNTCSWNVRIGWREGGTTNWKACMSPGGERTEPGRFNEALAKGC